MTKRNRLYFIVIALMLLSCFVFSACSYSYSKTPAGSIGGSGNNSSSGGSQGGSQSGNDENLATFVVNLVKENGDPYVPPEGSTVTVTWMSHDGFTMSKPTLVDGNGKAVCKDKLDGEYYITIDGLPSVVGYDPNIYSADNLHPEVTVTIFNVIETYVRYPGKGGSSAPSDVITFQLSMPYYRFKFTKDNQTIWCRLGPITGEKGLGKYEIESMCNIYNNDANPEFSLYAGNVQYVNDQFPLDTVGSGGVSSSFTKNFFYVIDHTTTEEGAFYYYFSLKCAKLKTAEYPVYVDLHIRKVPTTEDISNRPILYAGEEEFYDENGQLKDFGITSSSQLVATSGNLMDYNFKLDENGYYRQVNEDGTLGGYVFTKIIGANPVVEGGGWQQPEASVKDYITGLDYTFLLRGKKTVQESSQEYADPTSGQQLNLNNPNAYTPSEVAPIYEKGISYYDYCQTKGINYYPVTVELKNFLQHYCTGQLVFMDGDSPYETTYGYVSDHESMWKIFCYTLQ